VAGVWLSAGALSLAALGWELFWRRRGFVPWVRDDWPAWALVRRSVRLKGHDAVALIGASRLQVALVPAILAELTGRRPAMLAVDGCSPLAVLADLAGDKAFNGTVLCSLTPAALAEPEAADDRAAKWIRKSHRISTVGLIGWRFCLALQGRLACLSPDLTFRRLRLAAKTAAWPRPHRAPMARDRSRALHYERTDADALRRARERRERAVRAAAHPLAPRDFTERLRRIGGWVDAIRARGGRIVFLRLPSSGEVRELERLGWPRERYWDRLAAVCTAARSIHFEDEPLLAGFNCPDGSHLGAEDARRFSRALVRILKDGARGERR
jgi:hypothetical protein